MLRVLCVDDERRVLDGLRRSLRPLRPDWSILTATSGREALELMGRESFDVIVSDMCMPSMDGAELLDRARIVQPGAVRVVLSGQTDLAIALRAVRHAHRFLAKPCTGELLVSVLERGDQARASLASVPAGERLVGLGSLPSTAAKLAALADVVGVDAVDVDALVAVVASDVAMHVKVLQLTASSFFGRGRAACDLREAVTLLGGGLIRQLVEVGAFPTGACEAPLMKVAGVVEVVEAEAGPTPLAFASQVGALALTVIPSPNIPVEPLVVGQALLGIWGIG